MKTKIISAAFLFVLGACGNKETTAEPKKDTPPTAAVNTTKTEAPPIKTPGKDTATSDAKPADVKPEDPKPADAKPAGTALYNIPDSQRSTE